MASARLYPAQEGSVLGVKMSCKSDKWATFLELRSTGAGTVLSAKQLIAQHSEGPTKYS